MGTTSSELYRRQQLTDQVLTHSVNQLFDNDQLSINNLPRPINRILQSFRQNYLITKRQTGLLVNPCLLHILYHPRCNVVLNRLLTIFIDKLLYCFKRLTIILVSRQEWKLCQDLCNFLIILSDQRITQVIQSLSVRTDIDVQTKKLLKQFSQKQQECREWNDHIISMWISQPGNLEKCLRICLFNMIELHHKIISRSAFTLKIISHLEMSCFILYLKLLYHPCQSSLIRTTSKNQHLHTNLSIGTYFIAAGINQSLSSIYEIGILFILKLSQQQNLINKNIDKKVQVFPPHIFKVLPIINSSQLYYYVVSIVLFALCFVKDKNNKMHPRFIFNRLQSYKMLIQIIKQVQCYGNQIKYYIEELCFQCSVGQIERAFLHQLCTVYLKNDQSSEVIKKFMKNSSSILYNVKVASKQIKVSNNDVITELQNDKDVIQNQLTVLNEKYIYECILRQKMQYFYQDKQIWKEIIKGIIENQEEKIEQNSMRSIQIQPKQSAVQINQDLQDIQKQIVAKQKYSNKKQQHINIKQQQIKEKQIKINKNEKQIQKVKQKQNKINIKDKEIQNINQKKQIQHQNNKEQQQNNKEQQQINKESQKRQNQKQQLKQQEQEQIKQKQQSELQSNQQKIISQL